MVPATVLEPYDLSIYTLSMVFYYPSILWFIIAQHFEKACEKPNVSGSLSTKSLLKLADFQTKYCGFFLHNLYTYIVQFTKDNRDINKDKKNR